MKALNLQIYGRNDNEKFDAQNFGHLLEIKNSLQHHKRKFPYYIGNSEIVIADECWMDDFGDYYLTNLCNRKRRRRKS